MVLRSTQSDLRSLPINGARDEKILYIIESARILRDDIQLAAETTERPPVEGMTMCRTENVRPRRMDRRVYHEGRCVEQTAGTSIYHVPGVIDLDQIASFDLTEGDAEWVHPECGRIDWVADGNVTGNSYSNNTD